MTSLTTKTPHPMPRHDPLMLVGGGVKIIRPISETPPKTPTWEEWEAIEHRAWMRVNRESTPLPKWRRGVWALKHALRRLREPSLKTKLAEIVAELNAPPPEERALDF